MPGYDRAMQVRAEADARAFAERSMPFLLEDAGRNNLPITILSKVLDGVYTTSRHWIAERDGVVVGVALQTPPHQVLLAEPTEAEAVDALAEAIDDTDVPVPGVVANVPWAERFATRRGARWRVGMDQGVYELREVIPPRPTPGAARPAGPADRELVLRWIRTFEDEALPAHHVRDEARTQLQADVALGPDARSGYLLWEAGRPVSLTGFGRYPYGARIGPVYTPPAHRRHGYASNLVAHVSASMLAAGDPACYLYTDMANPTSNRIYTDVGFRAIARSQELVFEA